MVTDSAERKRSTGSTLPYDAPADRGGGSQVDKSLAFRKAFRELQNRIKIFVSLPLGLLDSLRLQERLDEIGHTRAE